MSRWHQWYYGVYLKSEHWEEYRRGEYQRARYCCEHCDATNTKLVCHHNDYHRLWREIPGVSTTVLCDTCHQYQHSRYQTFAAQQAWAKGRA